MYVEIPNVPGTPESRIAALKESRELLKGEPATKPVIFAGNGTEPGKVADSTELINLATYIETGHAHTDLHPTGKRRPIIKHTHVTVMAPSGASEGLEHLLSHINDGSFGEFLDDVVKQHGQDDGEPGEPGDTESK